MPWTFAHPAAVIPLRNKFNFLALVIGSITPDFGYYIGQKDIAEYSHSVLGSIFSAFPISVFLYLTFYLLRSPLNYLLPELHRLAIGNSGALRKVEFSTAIPRVALSLLIGIWTHTLWDSFTHEGSWIVDRIEFLRMPVFHIGVVPVPVCKILQHLSTFVGILILFICYKSWLSSYEKSSTLTLKKEDYWRYKLIIFLSIISLLVGIWIPFPDTPLTDYATLRVLLFKIIVATTSTFILLLILSSLYFYYCFNKRDKISAG